MEEIKYGTGTLPPAGDLCRNASNPGAWWCYHRNEKIIIGTELAAGQTECRACARVTTTRYELPSYVRGEEE